MFTDKLSTGQRSYTPDFGLYYYGSRWYDPALGRFIQPDTIVPDPFNPQDLNRFSYVRNNPLRYTDPSGHMLDDGCRDYGCGSTGGGGVSLPPAPQPRPRPDPEPAPAPAPSPLPSPLPSPTPAPVPTPTPTPLPSPTLTLPVLPVQTSISTGTPPGSFTQGSYCGGGGNGGYNFFDCGANISQDLALLVDAPFAGLEAVLIVAGCFGGPEGCLAGAGVGITVFNVSGANADETILSLVAAGFSVAADLADDRHFGESTVVAVSGAVLGLLSPDPILDSAIDGFGSAYNHGIKPISGIPSLIGSLFGR